LVRLVSTTGTIAAKVVAGVSLAAMPAGTKRSIIQELQMASCVQAAQLAQGKNRPVLISARLRLRALLNNGSLLMRAPARSLERPSTTAVVFTPNTAAKVRACGVSSTAAAATAVR
jgi:hypothetical protein